MMHTCLDIRRSYVGIDVEVVRVEWYVKILVRLVLLRLLGLA
jgi:hypothetical protein